jgi:hypothetical protein
LYWGYIVIFTKGLQYFLIRFTPPSFSFIPFSPFLEQFQQVSLFHFHIWICSPSTIFALLYSFLLPPPPPRYQHLDRTSSTFLPFFFFFKDMFVYDGYTGNIIVTFPCICVWWPELVNPLHYSPFYLSPLLMVILSGLNIPYSYLYRKYINQIHLLYFLELPFIEGLLCAGYLC